MGKSPYPTTQMQAAPAIPEPPEAEDMPELNDAPEGADLTDAELREQAEDEARARAESMNGRQSTILTPSDMEDADVDEPSLTKQKKRTTLLTS